MGVLIVNYYTYQDTIRYVGHLRQQRSIRLSVLIVDNCSPNESFPVLQATFGSDPVVRVIQSERNGGYAYGNNFGLRFWRSAPIDYLLISNNDIELNNPYLVAQMIMAYQELKDVGFVAPRTYTGGKENVKHQAFKIPTIKDSLFASLRSLYRLAHKFGWTNSYTFDNHDTQTYPVDCVSGAFFLGAKDVFFELGLFDEGTFLYNEEAILGKKVKAAGKQNYQLRSLAIHHIDGQTTRQLNTKYQLQKEWLKSTMYYHRHYEKSSEVALLLLRMLYVCWVMETTMIELFRKVED